WQYQSHFLVFERKFEGQEANAESHFSSLFENDCDRSIAAKGEKFNESEFKPRLFDAA
ncbi:hypothetical protein K0M31_017566, partial [Melipona bicolor]